MYLKCKSGLSFPLFAKVMLTSNEEGLNMMTGLNDIHQYCSKIRAVETENF